MLSVGIFATLIAAAASTLSEDPLARADKGLVQCYEPNDTAKTCQSIAGYQRNGDGTWANTAVVLIDATRALALETVTMARVENGEVCGYVRAADVLKGKLYSSGRLVPSREAARILGSVASSMGPMLNRKICTAYVQRQDGLVAQARIVGGTVPIPDQRVRWVLPSDGYKVAPDPTTGGLEVVGG